VKGSCFRYSIEIGFFWFESRAQLLKLIDSLFVFLILECLLRSNLSKRSQKHQNRKTPNSQLYNSPNVTVVWKYFFLFRGGAKSYDSCTRTNSQISALGDFT